MLALLVGPLLVVLLQLSLRRGTGAALAAAVGIWVSDLSFVLLAHYGVGGLSALTSRGNFTEIVGTIGALLLLAVAVTLWFRRPPDLDAAPDVVGRRGLIAPFLQGFAINTFNPFTVTFWSLFSLTQVHDRQLLPAEATALYAGILFTIVITDLAKVMAAGQLRRFLRPTMLRRVQRLGAVLLAVFGVVLGVRVWWQ